MNVVEWLNGLVCVAPFTAADAGDVYTLLKAEFGKPSVVDVHITPTLKRGTRQVISEQVHVTIDSKTLKGTWTYDVKPAS